MNVQCNDDLKGRDLTSTIDECNLSFSLLSEGWKVQHPHWIPSISKNMWVTPLSIKNMRKSTFTAQDSNEKLFVDEIKKFEKVTSMSPWKKKTLKEDISDLLKIMVKVKKKKLGLKESKTKSNSWVLKGITQNEELSKALNTDEVKYVTMKEIQSIPESQFEE